MRNSQQMFEHSHRSLPLHAHRGLKDKGADCSFHNTQKLTSIKSLLIFFWGWGEGAGQDNLDLRLLQRSRSTFSRAERRSSVNKILVTAKREVSEFLCDYTIIFNYTFLCTLDSNFPTFAHLLINVYQFLHSLQDIKGIQGIDHYPFDN